MNETLWTFETSQYIVKWDIMPDDDCDLSFDETGEVADKVASGFYMCFTSHIYVEHKETGLTLGEAYLGGSIYENPKDFRDHFGINAKGYGSYFPQMVREAIAEARETIRTFNAPTL